MDSHSHRLLAVRWAYRGGKSLAKYVAKIKVPYNITACYELCQAIVRLAWHDGDIAFVQRGWITRTLGVEPRDLARVIGQWQRDEWRPR